MARKGPHVAGPALASPLAKREMLRWATVWRCSDQEPLGTVQVQDRETEREGGREGGGVCGRESRDGQGLRGLAQQPLEKLLLPSGAAAGCGFGSHKCGWQGGQETDSSELCAARATALVIEGQLIGGIDVPGVF